MSPAKGRTIQLSNVRARIPDLNHESILSIQGDTTASAMSYLSLMRHSPLGGLLEHVFDAAQGDGDWSIPLQLTIPLRRVRDTSVRGTINFHDGRITPLAGMPPLTHRREERRCGKECGSTGRT